ncbi:class A beta-lactamase [Sphingobium boeckii]|uniref:Beta-lactamase n=1 Tax=Sphingobium boeckii TaxID=1082345 RepID=A0A7W9AGC3_9SPHN|nr:class A beta-lactamase [Sphingobium boeckii]MBB5685193.1 beta-lactamase class A [Sphingobium boeckii]
MLGRRDILIGIGGATVGLAALPQLSMGRISKDLRDDALLSELERIERSIDGRMGFSLHDMDSGYRLSRRGGERFPMCSTFKFILAAATLKRVDQGRERLDRRIAIIKADMVEHAPVTEKHIGPAGMTVGALCEATMTQSDNPAANLLLRAMGGVAVYNAFLRSIGDRHSRLDRTEPAINESAPGDPRDTTMPDAMRGNLERLLIGHALTPASRATLTGWMIANKTGDKRLRAGLPKNWRIGDKTGAGLNGSNNDIAILWPPRRKPILMTSYLTESNASFQACNAAHQAVAAAVAKFLG